MTNVFKQMGAGPRWNFLVAAARKGMEDAGWEMKRKPGRGLSNTWVQTKQEQSFTAAIRTSQDRWLAFPPLQGGTKWKTLDDVQKVIVAVVDDKENPTAVEVYAFDAEEVRKRFAEAYEARIAAGHIVKDNYGLWINLDVDARQIPVSVGSGMATEFKPVATYSIAELMNQQLEPEGLGIAEDADDVEHAPSFGSIADVVSWARTHISSMAGVPLESVRLELKIQY